MKSGAEFIEEIKEFKPLIYCRGKKVEGFLRHPVLRPIINAAKATYDLAMAPENAELMTTISPLTGERCNLLSALFQSRVELVKTVKLRRWWHNTTGTCTAGRCAGTCVANAIYHCTFLLDREYNTECTERRQDMRGGSNVC
ncbi:aromatic ring hydroxylase [Desulfofundulus luciae]|uniref:Aromatic ring hydroxylase n=1 Tax=Desulfofundulus luciae TaxID=74702 RepID=A0ABU0B1E8_9FIRM|nr:4-hydroxyphenylacetate 3-hydroxylase N-terminal domain-containing protein [Desulfofundulus luciae]MDQ0286556.1 aromatic ring hydroxylase [Desulfofundulus luciae]